MNSIQDLEQQNLQDSWSILYLSLAKCLLQTPPVEQAESVLRAAIRSYASTIGRMERASNQAARLRINLNTFFRQPALRPRDPRLRVDIGIMTDALHIWAQDTAERLRQQAKELSQPLDISFADRHFPLYMNIDEDSLWLEYSNYGAKELLKQEFYNPLFEKLNLK